MNHVRIVLEEPKSSEEIHIDSLSQIPNSVFDSIDVGDVLDFVVERDKAIMLIIQKLKYEGSIIIHGTDILEVVRCGYIGLMDVAKLNEALYGGRASSDAINNIVNKLLGLGLTPVQKQIENARYYVKATRNPPSDI